jgi:hypothetical protein
LGRIGFYKISILVKNQDYQGKVKSFSSGPFLVDKAKVKTNKSKVFQVDSIKWSVLSGNTLKIKA